MQDIQNKEAAVHKNHCYKGEYENSCKYGDENCPAKNTLNISETLQQAANLEVKRGKYQDQESAIKFSFIAGAKWQEKRKLYFLR